MKARRHNLVLEQLQSAVSRHPELALISLAGNAFEIRGGPMTVTYYPQTKTARVNGTRGDQSWISPDEAVKMALTAPDFVDDRARYKRSGTQIRAHKMRMLRYHPFCHWCHKRLHPVIATVDHMIPISRGGNTVAQNLVLACKPCNKRRGADMPELKEAKNG